VAKVKLYYTKDRGSNWYFIIGDPIVGNPETYDWLVTAVKALRAKCKVEVVSKDESGNKVGID